MSESLSTPPRRYTAEDLLVPGMGDKWIELMDGRFVDRPPIYARPAVAIQKLYRQFSKILTTDNLDEDRLMLGSGRGGFQFGPETVLCFSLSVFERAKLMEASRMNSFAEFAPIVAVDVIRPGARRADILRKVSIVLDAGCEQFWLLNGEDDSIQVEFADSQVPEFHRGPEAVIRGRGLLEGTEVRLDSILHVGAEGGEVD